MPPRVRPSLHRDPAESTTGGDAGFTVLECLVSFVLLAVVSMAAVFAVVDSTKTSQLATDRTVASNLAQSDQNAAQALRYPSYPAPMAAKSVQVGSTTYSVTRTITNQCPPTPAYNTNQYMTVLTTVTWPPATPQQQVTMAQELAC